MSNLSARSWDVHLLVGQEGAEEFVRREGIAGPHVVGMSRRPAVEDVITVGRLTVAFRRLRPDVVVLGTPKMGIFGTIAAVLARVPVRVYVVHGFRAEGLRGPARLLMVQLERLACASATHIVAVSGSLMDVLVAHDVASRHKVQVLGAGTANGIDLHRFTPATAAERTALRARWGIDASSPVVACVGRITADKGLLDLPRVWRGVLDEQPSAVLLMAGVQEFTSAQEEAAHARLKAMKGVKTLGRIDDVEDVYRASDLNLLLSSREGMGMVALEAAACEVPTIGYRVTGLTDAVLDSKTGVLIPRGQPSEVVAAITRLTRDERERIELGRAGAARVKAEFEQSEVWERWAGFLTGALEESKHRNTVRKGF